MISGVIPATINYFQLSRFKIIDNIQIGFRKILCDHIIAIKIYRHDSLLIRIESFRNKDEGNLSIDFISSKIIHASILI